MQRTAALYGILGLVLLAFGLIDLFLSAGLFRFFVFVNIVGGLFALILWITSSWSVLGSFAGQRSTRYGANAVVYSVIIVLILVAVNYISSRHYARFDLTAEKVYSLSSQSINVVKRLKQPLRIYGFFEGGQNLKARRLYEQYAYASPKVHFELVDPDQHPELAEKFKITTLNVTHLEYGQNGAPGTNVSELTEEAITNGIIRVSETAKKTLCFLDGHGEANPDDNDTPRGFGKFKTALEGEGFEAKKLLLASEPAVPNDCSVLVVAGPERPLVQHELDALNAYLKQGGKALVMFRPPRPDAAADETALAGVIRQWGVSAGRDVVVDQVVRLFAGPTLGLSPLVSSYGDHPVTHDFNQRTVFPMTRSVTPAKEPKPGLTITALAKTSDSSWAETDVNGVFKRQEAKLDSDDIRGPVEVADAVDADLGKLGWGSGKARLVVFGSTDFADNQWIDQFYNRDLLVNSADWLAGEEKQISIRPRELRASRFRLTVDQFSLVFALSVLLLPELLMLTGIVVWWERRV